MKEGRGSGEQKGHPTVGVATLCGFLGKQVCLVFDCADRQVAAKAKRIFFSLSLSLDSSERPCWRITVTETLRGSADEYVFKVSPFLGDPAATLLKVPTNFSSAATSDEIQYTVGHLTVCATATHE